jgi:hypothetical protein
MFENRHIHHCIALLQLVYRWQHQSQKLLIPHSMHQNGRCLTWNIRGLCTGKVILYITFMLLLQTCKRWTSQNVVHDVCWFHCKLLMILIKEIGFWTLSIVRIFNRLNTQYSLVKIRTIDKVQEPISLIHQPSSEPFRIYLMMILVYSLLTMSCSYILSSLIPYSYIVCYNLLHLLILRT